MTTLAINKLWSFLQSLSLTAKNERWLAERLLESADVKSKKEDNVVSEASWGKYKLSQEIMDMTLNDRQNVSDKLDDSLYSALEEKYR